MRVSGCGFPVARSGPAGVASFVGNEDVVVGVWLTVGR